MVTDPSGNLYVPDFFNNRILRYDDPFNTDTVADYVWGQPGFNHRACNEGGTPSHSNLCLAPPPGLGMLKSGVEIDPNGNLWVADTQNNRVLRFPWEPILGRPGPTADLVLGQPDFSSKTSGAGLNQLNKPTSVRIDDGGTVYVADGGLGAQQVGRVLVFQPPFTNGMYAANTLGSLAGEPTGLELAPDGSLWVNESDNKRLLNFLPDGSLQVAISNVPTRVWGGLGIDSDGNVMTTGWDPQQVLRYSSPTFNQDVIFLAANEWGSFNEKGPRGFNGLALGLEVTENQLIVGDMGRILFWNTLDLSNHQPADGVIGQPDLYTNPRWDPVFGRMRADNNGNLWVAHGSLAFGYGMHPVIQAYNLPLTTGQPPHITIAPPIPLHGGGYFSWDWSLILAGIDVQPGCDCLWLSDERNHRVFRIREVTTNPTVDIILGQLDASGNKCNHDGEYNSPSQDSLCHPGAVTFDNEGNLFVADHNLEFDGNLRLLEWDAALLPSNPSSAVYGIPASRVFGRNNDFTRSDCLVSNPMCAPWEPTFNSQGQMVIGFNSYFGTRFPYVYGNPLADSPTANLFDFHSMPFSARFDQNDNLYILDHNRNRVLIYLQPDLQAGPDIQSMWLPIILK
jgi:sugar lactone lactonase YvrE